MHMSHITSISRLRSPAQAGDIVPLESFIIILLTIVFSDSQNLSAVLQNLQKFYRKT